MIIIITILLKIKIKNMELSSNPNKKLHKHG